MKYPATCLAIGVGSYVVAMPALAQDAPAPVPLKAESDTTLGGDIIVTATRRGESAQSIGISISALSGDQLTALGVKDTSALALYTPGLQLQSAGGEGNTMALTLRGVGQSDFNDNQEGPVAIYVDQVYSSALTGTNFLAFDLDRVEVLRGPQGTLFGRNATGGLVQFITRRPTKDFEGYVDLGYGRFNEVTAEGAVSGPLASNLQARLSVATQQRDRYFRNTFAGGEGGNGKNNFAGRLQLAWQPTDSVDIRLTARGAKATGIGPRGRHETTFIDPATGLASAVPTNVDQYGTGAGNDIAGYANRDSNYWSGAFDQRNPLTLSQWGTTGYVDVDLGAVKLFSITDYTSFYHRYREDSDLSPVRGLRYGIDSKIGQFSQELRVQYDSDAVKAQVGAYYLSINGRYQNQFTIYKAFATPLGLGPDDIGSLVPWTTRTRSSSVFAQAEVPLARTLKATAGVRWTSDIKRQVLDSYAVTLAPGQDELSSADINPAGSLLTATYRDRRADSFISWKLGLDWTPLPRTLVFASITRGQKGGGYNVPFFASDSLTGSFRFRPEQLTSYEGGIKISGSGFLRRFNISAYHYDYKDFQAFQFVNVAALIFNANARVTGAETEIVVSPIAGLTAQFGGAFVFDATAKNIGLPNGTFADRRLPLTPDAQLTGVLRYEIPVGTAKVATQLDGRYVTSQYYDVLNNPVGFEKGYGLLNARLFYTAPGDRWSASVFVENLTNTKYRAYVVDTGLTVAQAWLGEPRTYGVKLSYKFAR